METIKNYKNFNLNMIKKYLKNMILFTLTFIMLMTSVSGAVLYEDDQEITNLNYGESSIIGASTPSLVFNGGSDITENFRLTTTPLFVLLSSSSGNNETINISYYDSIFENFVTINYVVPSDDVLIIQLTPQNIDDKTSLILSGASGGIFYSYVFIHDSLRDNKVSVFTPLINGVVDLVEINITLQNINYFQNDFRYNSQVKDSPKE